MFKNLKEIDDPQSVEANETTYFIKDEAKKFSDTDVYTDDDDNSDKESIIGSNKIIFI